MKRFEYRVLELRAGDIWAGRVDNQTLIAGLNELGAEGWEVVSGFDSGINEQRPTVLMKREIPAQ